MGIDRVPLLGATRTRIVRQLAEGPRTAAQLATFLRIQVSATRKHLERLRTMAIVEERFERRGPGRPKKLYALTEEGRELFPRRYDAVLDALVSDLLQEQGEDGARRTLRRVARGLAKDAVPDAGTERAQIASLTKGLKDLGFEPTVATQARECIVTSHNCPILRTARARRELVCQGLHAEIVRAATGASEVRRGKWIIDGDSVCTHTFPVR